MSWQKPLLIILLFYLFALVQTSFLAHFSLFGTIPNLVFTLFFLLVFFIKKNENYQIIFFAFIAGIFLDIFSYTYIGPSIIFLLIIGFLLKKSQSLLKNRESSHPFIYFLPLFVIFLLAYDLSCGFYFYFFGFNKTAITLGAQTIFSVIYSALIASALFYIYKWQKFTK
jgi:rod shape-determining protein MreD